MKESVESLGRIRFQGIALLLLAFLAGALLGGFVGRFGCMRRHAFQMRSPGHAFESPWFFKRLDLTDEQERKVKEIIERYRPQTDSVLAEMTPRLRDLREQARAEIMEILTPEQRERFEKFSEKHLPFGPWMKPMPPPDTGIMKRIPSGPH